MEGERRRKKEKPEQNSNPMENTRAAWFSQQVLRPTDPGSSSRKTSAHGARESPTSVADLNFHFTKHSGSSGGTYPDSASNLFSGDLASEPDVPLTNWLNDVNDVMKNDSDSSDCCSFLAPGEQMIYADTNADQWDDPWDFDPAAFVTGSLLVGDT